MNEMNLREIVSLIGLLLLILNLLDNPISAIRSAKFLIYAAVYPKGGGGKRVPKAPSITPPATPGQPTGRRAAIMNQRAKRKGDESAL